MGKRARGMGLWGSFIARARVRRGRRALPGAIHGGVAVAAVWMALEAARVRGTAGEAPTRGNRRGRRSSATRGRQREQEAAVKALHGAGVGALHGGGEKQSRELGEKDKGRFEISITSRDHSVNKQ